MLETTPDSTGQISTPDTVLINIRITNANGELFIVDIDAWVQVQISFLNSIG